MLFSIGSERCLSIASTDSISDSTSSSVSEHGNILPLTAGDPKLLVLAPPEFLKWPADAIEKTEPTPIAQDKRATALLFLLWFMMQNTLRKDLYDRAFIQFNYLGSFVSQLLLRFQFQLSCLQVKVCYRIG